MTDILLEIRDGDIAILTMNRPKARNSLSLAMMAALNDAVLRLGADAGVKAIVLTGEGPAFCAGHDLKEMAAARDSTNGGSNESPDGSHDGGRAFFTQTMQACARLMQDIVACPKPVIAAVDGIATAAGCQLVASCDLAVASASSRFATPGVNIGLFCSTPMVAVSRNIPRKRVMEMLLMGEMISAETAADWGLINRVVDQDPMAEALSMAQVIASKSPATVKIGIEAFYKQAELPLDQAYDYTAQVMVDNMMHRDAEEGINAFIEKRHPQWQG